MTISSLELSPTGRTVELLMALSEVAPGLDRYLIEALEKLDRISNRVRDGEPIERETRDWMLSQVDFVVETMGDESLELSEGSRSILFELLLSVANLNEHIRRQASSKIHAE